MRKKVCKIIPKYRKPVFHILPNGKTISVPSQMPLNSNQILKATMQASVYEVIEGRGDVLLTARTRDDDNSKLPVSLNVPAIVNYYNDNGELVNGTVATTAENVAPVEDPVVVPVEEPKADPVRVEEPTSPVEDGSAVNPAPVEDPVVVPVEEPKADPVMENTEEVKEDSAAAEDVTPVAEPASEPAENVNENHAAPKNKSTRNNKKNNK